MVNIYRYPLPFILKCMRISAIILCIQTCCTATLLAGTLFAQTVKLNIEKAPIKEVFTAIEKQAGVSFAYNEEVIKDLPQVSLKINAPLNKVLQSLSDQLPLQFKQAGGIIGVSRIPEKKPAKESQPPKDAIRQPQQRDINGTVSDTTGEPISGATVKLQNSINGTVTNAAGHFKLSNIPDNGVIVISFIGFKTQVIAFDNATPDPINVVLHTTSGQLEQVAIVSTGYQELPKERATGSFDQIDNAKLNGRVSLDVFSRLEGIASGVLFPNKNIPIGSNEAPFSIRGRSTLFANTKPLIVVDNFPYDGDLNNINPNDVASITILKDAAAASIWGAFSGNGVIIITTKKAKLNQPLKVEFNANVTIGEKPDLYYGNNFLNSKSFIGVEKFLFSNGFYDGNLNNIASPVTPVVQILAQRRAGLISAADSAAQIGALSNIDYRRDLSKYFYQPSIAQQYSLNLSGGSEKNTYLVSFGYDDGRSNLVRNGNDRYTLNTYNTFRPFKRFELSLGTTYSYSTVIKDNSGTVTSGPNSLYPYAQLAGANGNALPVVRDYNPSFTQNPGTGLLDWQYRPINDLNLADNQTNEYDIRFSPGLKYTILPGLSAEVRFQYENQNTQNPVYYNVNSYYTRNLINEFTQVSGSTITTPIPIGGILDQNYSGFESQDIRGQLNFNKTINQKNEINVIAGAEQKQIVYKVNDSRLYGYSKDDLTANPALNYTTFYSIYQNLAYPQQIPTNFALSQLNNEYISYFGNASYIYDSRYIISGSARLDQSNLFGVNTNQKGTPLWSIGAGWNLSNEKFYSISWLPYAKLRITYGLNGNIDKNIYGITTIRFNPGTNLAGLPNGAFGTPNPDLRWESVATTNIGFDFGLIRNILSGSVEYYSKNSKNLIGSSIGAPSTGVTSVTANIAGMKSQGTDVTLNSRNMNGTFKWSTDLVLSYNKDNVNQYAATYTNQNLVQSGDGTATSQLIPVAGYPLYSVYSFKWAGLDNKGNPQGYLNGQVSEDYPSMLNSKDNSQVVYNGPARPTVFGSLGNNFSFGHFNMTVNISYKLGYYFRRNSIDYTDLFNNWIGNADFDKRWQQPGDETHTNVPSMIYPNNIPNRDDFYKYSSVLVDNGDNIRLQYIEAGYTFNEKQLSKVPFKNVRVYFYANNLGILWRANKDGLDPDYVNGYPTPRTFALGLRTNF